MSYIKEGNKILLGPNASCALVTPHLAIPSQYLYEPLGVSGVMFAPTASGTGSNFECEMMTSNVSTVTANGNEIRIKNGTLKMTDLFSLYEVWKDSPSPWAGAFPRKFNPYDIQPLIFSADIKVNKVDSNGQLKFAVSANTNTDSKTAVNLFSGTFPLTARIPISNYGTYFTAYNGAYSADGKQIWTNGNASAKYFNWTWGGDVDNNEATAWIDHVQKARMSFNNKWYAFSGIEAYNCDVSIKDFKLIYFSYDRANAVNSQWNEYSSYYPDGVKPDYIAQKKPIIG